MSRVSPCRLSYRTFIEMLKLLREGQNLSQYREGLSFCDAVLILRRWSVCRQYHRQQIDLHLGESHLCTCTHLEHHIIFLIRYRRLHGRQYMAVLMQTVFKRTMFFDKLIRILMLETLRTNERLASSLHVL